MFSNRVNPHLSNDVQFVDIGTHLDSINSFQSLKKLKKRDFGEKVPN